MSWRVHERQKDGSYKFVKPTQKGYTQQLHLFDEWGEEIATICSKHGDLYPTIAEWRKEYPDCVRMVLDIAL